jgi:uncharacterized membrane protein
MLWLTRYRIIDYVHKSAWLVPTMAIPLALAVSRLTQRLDRATQWRGLAYTPGGAASLLNALTPATLTFIILILSTLLLTIQMASSQLSPRLIGGLLSRRPVKVCLAIFVFSYVYCAATMGRVEERVLQLCVVMAIALTLISVGAGLFLIDYMAKELRPVRMLSSTAGVGRTIIEQVYPNFATGAEDKELPAARPTLPHPSETIVHAGRSAVLLAMDVDGLMRAAQKACGAIEIIPQVGDFVARGDPLFRVHPGLTAIKPWHLYGSLAFGVERTPEQDPTFVFRILVDVASKALSPAINDPTTAVLAIDQIHHLLRQVGIRRLDTGEVRDAAGHLRVLYRTPDWDDFVLLAVSEIRQYGATSIQVARRLRAMLENLSSAVSPHRALALREQLQLLHSSVERGFGDPRDRVRAQTSDLQGVGGSRTGNGRATQ